MRQVERGAESDGRAEQRRKRLEKVKTRLLLLLLHRWGVVANSPALTVQPAPELSPFQVSQPTAQTCQTCWSASSLPTPQRVGAPPTAPTPGVRARVA